MAAVLVVDSGHLVFGVFFSVCLFDGVFFINLVFVWRLSVGPNRKNSWEQFFSSDVSNF